jgi:predicted transcriptional regulator
LSKKEPKEKEAPESEEERLADLLFELSNSDRLRLLTLLVSGRHKLSSLAEKTSQTVQETSRHLERLGRSGLIDRNAAGEYFASQIGKICVSQLQPFTFVVRNHDYLADHDLTVLPEKFARRLGELTMTSPARNVTDVLRHAEAVLRDAKEYVMLMADQALIPGHAIDSSFSNRNVTCRFLIPRSEIPPESETLSLPANFQTRFLSNPKVGIALNEEIAGVTFLDDKGKLDMSAGFSGKDPSFHEWCRELFEYFWNKASESGEASAGFEF